MTLVLCYLFFLMLVPVTILYSSLLVDSSGLLVIYNIMGGSFSLDICLALDTMSLTSVMLVLYISGCVFLFSNSYLKEEKHSDRFILLLAGFVLSMVILLISGSVPILLVGWDGLGVTSFLLIIYYDSKTNNRSGMITFGVNRFGDAILIGTLILFISEGSLWMSGMYLGVGVSVSYMLVSMTKSAQYPFSMWLPLAMDAPTPVSALVHSSTLVTAGLFLMGRILPEHFNPYLSLIGSVTLCVGGFCAVFSADLKKLIANSTLSNLGLMVFILSLSDKSLMLFHLFTHALFKAGLFISAGAMLMSSFGVQDSRSLYGLGKSSPLLSSLVSCFMVSSMGLFFLSTFFSKHQIMLTMQMMPMNMVCMLLAAAGAILTAIYSLRFSYIMLSSLTKSSVSSAGPASVLLSIMLLATSSLWYGNFFSNTLVYCSFCYEAPLNLLTGFGVFTFLMFNSSLSSNMGKSMLQMDSMMDSLTKTAMNMSQIKAVDMGFGSVESKEALTSVNKVSSLMVGTMSTNRVNLSLIFISLCSMSLFF